MWQDEIVEETRRARDTYAAQFDYDLAAIFRDLSAKEQQAQQTVVALSPHRPVRILLEQSDKQTVDQISAN